MPPERSAWPGRGRVTGFFFSSSPPSTGRTSVQFFQSALRMMTAIGDQILEDGQHLFTVVVHPLQIVAESGLKPRSTKPLSQQRLRNVDIAPERVSRMAPQKKSIEHRSLTLRGKRVEVVSELSVPHKA